MPPKQCASCSKMVYPMEELKCLDKMWHKACFKCQVCNMTLGMKNYKGYNKLPYCNAHYPETKFTAVADTPENQRLAKNTKNQSQVKYHEDFEKSKGQYIAVADDPETLRVKKNMQTISNVAYHGELARKEEMEQYRNNEDSDQFAAPHGSASGGYQKQQSYTSTKPFMDFTPVPIDIPYDYVPPAAGPRSYSRPVVTIGKGGAQSAEPRSSLPVNNSMTSSPYSGKVQAATVYSSQPGAPQQGGYRRPGSINDYDPMAEQPAPQRQPSYQGHSYTAPQPRMPSHQPPASYQPPTSYQPPASHQPRQPAYQPPQQPMGMQHQQPPPMGMHQQQPMGMHQQQPMGMRQQQPVQQPMRQPAVAPAPPAHSNRGKVSQAIYDYSAADADEVSFAEGDYIINCEPIDDGWMMGTVEKTGQHGMLPSNYVEGINW